MKGVYILIIQVNKDVSLNVGALGKVQFEKGTYAYVGSAQTSLEKRINRHLRKHKRKFWHIDYLLDEEAAKIAKVFVKKAHKTEECETAKILDEKGRAISGFGCSDCSCNSHLFHICDYRFLQETSRVFPAET